MRTIIVEFEIPKEFEEGYEDVHTELAMCDWLENCRLPFKIISDSASQQSNEPDRATKQPKMPGFSEFTEDVEKLNNF